MNGRLYDPKLHRFLQPDNYVQDPMNTQNYNRYGYCWNNPTKFTDPSGEIIPLLIGGIILASVAINVYQNWDDITGNTGKLSDVKLDKFIGYAGSGAIAGALTVYAGTNGIIYANTAQAFLNSSIRNGANFEKIASDTFGGALSGIVSYGVGLGFDKYLPKGVLGGNNLFNSIVTGATKEVFTSFTGNFAGNYWNTNGNFEESLKSAANPFSLGLSAVGGGLQGGLNFKTKNLDAKVTPSPIINELQLQTLPLITPLHSQILPTFQIAPPIFQVQNLNGRIRIKPKN